MKSFNIYLKFSDFQYISMIKTYVSESKITAFNDNSQQKIYTSKYLSVLQLYRVYVCVTGSLMTTCGVWSRAW